MMKKKLDVIMWISLICFIILAILVKIKNQMLLDFDNQIGNFMLTKINVDNTNMFKIVAKLGSPLTTTIAISIILSVLYFLKKKRLFFWSIGVFFGGSTLALVFKYLIARKRPSDPLLFDSGYSFPSGHVTCTCLLLVVILSIFLATIDDQEQKFLLILVCGIFLILVMLSRIYLRAHYTTDVIGSILLSVFWTSLMLKFKRTEFTK